MSLNMLFHGVDRNPSDAMTFDSRGTGLPTLSPVTTRPSGPRPGTPKDQAGGHPDAVGPWIACHETAGVIEIHDPRLLCRGHEAFCRALVEAAVARFGAHRAEVSLETLQRGPQLVHQARLDGVGDDRVPLLGDLLEVGHDATVLCLFGGGPDAVRGRGRRRAALVATR